MRDRRGLTMVELLVVIAIVAALLGIGAAAWSTFRSSSSIRSQHGLLAGAARRARVFALEESASGRLVLDCRSAPNSFHAEGWRLLGLWHFEGSAGPAAHTTEVGFADRQLFGSGAQRVPGYRGSALRLPGPASLTIADGDFRFPAGGELTCWLHSEVDSAAQKRRQMLFSRGRELALQVNIAGELEARVGAVTVKTDGYWLPPMRWTQVGLRFSPGELTIAVDGAVRARAVPGDLPSRKEEELPLVFGDEGSQGFPFVGSVDELAVRRLAREGAHALPSGMSLVGDLDEVRFDGAGMLDRRYHGGPVRIGIRAPDSNAPDGEVTRWVTVSMDGEIREE